jgi:hypothetical protein
MVTYIVTASLESYYIIFSTRYGNQNRHTGDVVEHKGTFLPLGWLLEV